MWEIYVYSVVGICEYSVAIWKTRMTRTYSNFFIIKFDKIYKFGIWQTWNSTIWLILPLLITQFWVVLSQNNKTTKRNSFMTSKIINCFCQKPFFVCFLWFYIICMVICNNLKAYLAIAIAVPQMSGILATILPMSRGLSCGQFRKQILRWLDCSKIIEYD